MDWEVKEKYLAISWEKVEEACFNLSRKIELSEYKPEVIVAISRGGLVPARLIADHIGVPELTSMEIQFYKGMKEAIPKPIITQDISTSVREKNILIVDDVVDSGRSMKAAYEHLKKRGAYAFRLAVLYKKPWSLIKPDYFVYETDFWIIFPWEVSESLLALYEKFRRRGLSEEEILNELEKIGFERKKMEDLISFHKRYGRIKDV